MHSSYHNKNTLFRLSNFKCLLAVIAALLLGPKGGGELTQASILVCGLRLTSVVDMCVDSL